MKKIGIILSNLGTPDSPTPQAVARYLWQFLTDPRVVDLPRWRWLPLLKWIILPRRAKRIAKTYQSVWQAEGSPLLAITRRQQAALQQYLENQGLDCIVEIGMTYGNPSMASAVQNLIEKQTDEIIVLPLYPQYSSTTTGAALDSFTAVLKNHRAIPPFKFIHSYHLDENYIQALAESIKVRFKSDEFLLFSFHGIPLRYEENGDYYREHCKQTVLAVVDQLGLSENQWGLSFQSRFGREEWLQPYTDQEMKNITARQGVQKIALICPGFAADCLETLEEIEQENRALFLQHGGTEFQYIPALNADKSHIEMLAKLILNEVRER
ncbi:ferrochelatase [Caviibacterium pharyngocola]|uniref:Ferrochelatase n=1 Tax=Caviibacterium pharyngocola TaxID=28159 RepID=A0A2M8RUW8_9PAST|nr:ferrochelatase [Caviibacterium pharyngocola]PJG82659.1 ferrochelatase [Caviibacterium pharyngocola]